MHCEVRPLTRSDLVRADREHLVAYLQAHGVHVIGGERTRDLREQALFVFDQEKA